MTNFIDLIQSTADTFEALISSCPHVQEIETEDFGWSNRRFISSQFRLAHVERFEQPKFSVLHTVIFPHIMDPSPIFGFDIIASDTKATGLFFDLSPTILPGQEFSPRNYSEPRERPEWGSIFSEYWVACRPSFDEAQEISLNACRTLTVYLNSLMRETTPQLGEVVRAQNNYSLQQRQNEHTTRVILKILGADRGKHFIENILFPVI